MRGRALLIATSRYADPDLAPLPSAELDAQGLAPILADPLIGDLAVERCLNLDSHTLREQIEAFFASTLPEEFVLLYISGHGFKDGPGRLYFAAVNTRKDRPLATAIPSSFIHDAASNGRSRRVVMIFDSCFSGAFSKGWTAKADAVETVNLGDYFDKSTGLVVITATDTTQYALAREGQPSLFTQHLIAGLSSGAADIDGDGRVSSAELVQYVSTRIRSETQNQEPRRWAFDLKGDLVIAANRAAGELPREIHDLIENPAVLARAHAVERLSGLLAGKRSSALKRAAREALERLETDPERQVARAAAAALVTLTGSPKDSHLAGDVVKRLRQAPAAAARGRSTAEIPGLDLLPKHITVLLGNPEPEARLHALAELARVMADRSPYLRVAARHALRWLMDDPDARVSKGAVSALSGLQRRPGDVFVDGPDCPEMVLIPPGHFVMGSPETELEHSNDEGPDHVVDIGYSLAVAKYPVTRGEWRRYLAKTRQQGSSNAWGFNEETWEYEQKQKYGWSNPGFPQEDSHPVVCVSWAEAMDYAQWLSANTGHRYRLLSEAEHEYVNRAGTQSYYWWGDSHGIQWRYANGADAALMAKPHKVSRVMISVPDNDGFAYSSPVGHYPANHFGLHDTTGNVGCWTLDRWHENYEGAPADGSAWELGDDRRRVVRGGSWCDSPSGLRSACRSRQEDAGYSYVGFRVARTVS